MAGDNRGVRLGVLGVVAIALFMVLMGRLLFLQVMAAPQFEELVSKSRLREVPLPPLRGRILDAKGRVLADNRRSLDVTVDRAVIKKRSDRAALFERLAGVLQTTPDELQARYADGNYSVLLPLPVAEDVDETVATYLEERREDYPGVEVVEGSSRVYTYAPLASQIIGYLGAIPANDAKQYRARGYQPSDRVGIAGVEQSFEDQLRGKPGKRVFEIDAKNRITRVVEEIPPTPGNDLELTIDMQVQQYAEMVLGEALRERRTQITKDQTQYGEQDAYYSAPTGSVVVEDPATGRIIAMASYPTFDNRWFTQPIAQSVFDALFKTNDPEKAVLVNRAITGRYQLGSTMKMISATAGLLYNQLPAGAYAKFNDTGEFVPSNCDAKKDPKGCGPKHNAAGVHYGTITLPQALAVSSDVYFYNVGERLWLNTDKGTLALQTTARNYGLGTESGIDLPNEYAGIVPDKDVKRRLGEQSNYKAISRQEASDFFTGDNVQLAIGQGLLTATPLQLANAYATFANGGTRYRPLIANAVLGPGSPKNTGGAIDVTKATVVSTMEPQPKATVDLPPEYRKPLLEGLEQVITGPIANGHFPTAFGLFNYVPGYDYKAFPIAGKTGTAQDNTKLASHDTSLFAAFGPVDSPQYVVAAVLEKAGYGSEAAAPVTKCMFEALSGQAPLPALEEPDPLDRTQIKPVEIAPPPDTSCLKIYESPNANKVD